MKPLQDRVKKLVRVKGKYLKPCPWNWRVHPDHQKKVLEGVLGEIGIAGVQLAVEIDEPPYKYMLVDGHMRRDTYPPEQKVPVVVLDLSIPEAKKLLLAYDPISQLATTDGRMLGQLLREVETGNKALAGLFSDLGEKSNALNPADLDLDLEDDGEEVNGEVVDTSNIPLSHVRMVQLYLNTENLPKFQKYLAALAEKHGTKTATDTVLAVMRSAYLENKKAKKQKRASQ